ESLERNFMSQAFDHLMPNLTALTQRYTYFQNMTMGAGSSWTVGSMYTYMTGIPLFYGGWQTNPFQQAAQIQLPNLGYILQQAGYQTRYVLGMPDFAGMGDANRLFGIDVVSEQTYPQRYPTAPFGLYDRDVFNLAKHELDKMRTSTKPFALFISTVSTHAPEGFPDPRMTKLVAPRDNDFEFAVASLDYNLGQFIDYLQQQGLLANTVFYIFPDHNVMGKGASVAAKLSQFERHLYLLTNATADVLGKSVTEEIYQIDLIRLILRGAQIKHNATFLTDFIDKRIDKRQFIERHKAQI